MRIPIFRKADCTLEKGPEIEPQHATTTCHVTLTCVRVVEMLKRLESRKAFRRHINIMTIVGFVNSSPFLLKNTMQNACVSLAHINLQSYIRETICAGNKDPIPEDLLYEPRANYIAELSLVAFLMFTRCNERTIVMYVCACVIEVLKFIPDFLLMIGIVLVIGCEVELAVQCQFRGTTA